MTAAGAAYLLPALRLAACCEGSLCGCKGVRQAIWPGAADLSQPWAGVLCSLHERKTCTPGVIKMGHIWLNHG